MRFLLSYNVICGWYMRSWIWLFSWGSWKVVLLLLILRIMNEFWFGLMDVIIRFCLVVFLCFGWEFEKCVLKWLIFVWFDLIIRILFWLFWVLLWVGCLIFVWFFGIMLEFCILMVNLWRFCGLESMCFGELKLKCVLLWLICVKLLWMLLVRRWWWLIRLFYVLMLFWCIGLLMWFVW